MLLLNSRLVLSAIAATPSLFGLVSGYERIVGYIAENDVSTVLNQDKYQNELEGIIGDESRESLALGKEYYETGNGTFFKGLPTYKGTKSDTLKIFEAYYGSEDFCDKWVTAALNGERYTFSEGEHHFGEFVGNIDDDGECVGREECTKKFLAYVCGYVNIFQYLEQAVQLANSGCVQQLDGCQDAVSAWDKAVAFWAGSLEGSDGNNDGLPGDGGSYGKSFYALADKRCDDFRTCSATRDTADRGTPAAINVQLLQLFSKGSRAIYSGDIEQAKITVKELENSSKVPLIQGTLRYAYRLGNGSDKDKEAGEGAAFGGGIFPNLWKCDTKAHQIAFKMLQVGKGSLVEKGESNFKKLRLAFECNYECLGVTCEEVGALFDGIEFDQEGGEFPLPKPLSKQCKYGNNVCGAKTPKECKKYTSKPNKLFLDSSTNNVESKRERIH